MQPIRRFLALVAVPALAALAATPAGAAPSASSVTFGPSNCQSQYFTVPANVTAIVVDAWGGAGGHNEHTGAGGLGAHVRTALSVQPGEQLTLDVGVWGDAHGGCGLVPGGDRGGAIHGDAAGRDGYGGGSGTAVSTAQSDVLVVAGGGGGGGGNGGFGPDNGGDGGNGGATGWFGFSGTPGAYGGCGGCSGAWSGAEGDDQTWGSGGAGGGGGGGYPQGGGGGHGSLSDGGGGGGGGSSYAVTANPIVTSGDRICPYPDYTPSCDGAVTITWDLTPASIAATAGGGQQAQAGTIFDQRLSATVLNAEGLPVEGVAVTFALPSGGPSGSWPAGDGATASATTDANGLAVAPLLRAGGSTGAWSVTASAAGAGSTGFALATTRATTTTRVSASVDPSLAGQLVTFTANVSATAAPARWSGTVTFHDGSTALGAPVAIAADGSAVSPPQQQLALGDHQIIAVFSGDADHDPSTSAVLDQQVRAVPTAVTLSSDLNPSTSGETVAVTATVAAHGATTLRPTGAIQFSIARQPGDAADPVGAPVALDGDGQASATLPLLDDGAYAVTASYSGPATFEPGSGTLVQTVGPDATATALTSSVNPSVVGQPFTLTAIVARTGAGVEPSGSVTFRAGADAPLCAPVPLSAGATADCAVGGELSPVAQQLTAAFLDPDSQYEPSGGSMTQRVAPASTATTLAVVPGSSAFGAPQRLRAEVAVVAPGAGEPVGNVQFAVDGRAVGTPVAVVDGFAESAPIEGLAAGPRQLSAAYADGTVPLVLEPSRATATLVVTPAPTSIEIASSAAVAQAGQALVFTATAVATTGAPVSDGDVQFLLDGAPLGAPVDVVGGVAVSPTVNGLAPGSHTITAELNGGAEFLPSSVTVTQPVTAAPVDPPPVDRPPIGMPPPAQPAPPTPPTPPSRPGRRTSPRAARLVLAARTARASRAGAVALALRCDGTAGTRCRGRLTLRSGRATVGAVRYSLQAGRRATVRIALTRAARRTLAGRGRLTLAVRTAPTAGKGASGRLTVRAASAR